MMLDNPGGDLRDLEHLPPGHRDHRRVDQPAATPATHHRLMPHRLVRHIDLPQSPPLMTVLATRTTSRTPPQRLRSGLVQTLRLGRHVRVPRRLTQPAPQLRVLRLERLDPLICPRKGLLHHGKPLQQLHDGRQPRHPDILPNNPTKIKSARNGRPD
jgi:hypothetical protein